MIEIVQIEVGLLKNFNELVAGPGGSCAVVDPAYEVDRLLRLARERNWRVTAILVTHTHHDHIDGVAELAAATGAPAYVGAGEADTLRRAAPDVEIRPISDGETVSLDGE